VDETTPSRATGGIQIPGHGNGLLAGWRTAKIQRTLPGLEPTTSAPQQISLIAAE